jgi:biopolymer transport protein ExbB
LKRLLWILWFLASYGVCFFLWWKVAPTLGDLGQTVYEGGPLVSILIWLVILVFTVVLERMWSLKKAQGRGNMIRFLVEVKKKLHTGDIDGAIAACDKQRGSAANVLRAGLMRYQQASKEGLPADKVVAETQAAIQEANALEVPLLERNLIALSTIASIATMVGLLGTTVGMIRAFAAMGTSGAVDASQLAVGISEALVNTAGGLTAAILGIVAYNVFTTKVDNFNYMIDEASFEAIQLITARGDVGGQQG